MMSRHLFTTEPLPVPIGSVDRRRAMVCCEADCYAIFMPSPTCPACASERMIPLARWLDRVPRSSCRCGHGEASHRHLDECREDGCPCGLFIPTEEEEP